MLQLAYYAGLFATSMVLTLVYVAKWRKQYEVHMSVIFALIPVVNLAYLLMYVSGDPQNAMAIIKIAYFGGCFLPWIVTMCELNLCKIEIPRAVRLGTLILSTIVFCSVLTVGYSDVFYADYFVEQVGEALVHRKTYGPLHLLQYVCIIFYMVTDVWAIVYSYKKRRQVSRAVLLLLSVPAVFSMLGYIAGHAFMATGIELTPLSYVIAQIVYLGIVRRMGYYNVSKMVVESMVQSGETGFVTVDRSGRYLGSNDTARRILPELDGLMVDQPIDEVEALRETVAAWLARFVSDESAGRLLFARTGADGDERIYAVRVGHLYDGEVRCGYQMFIQDDTANQRYIRLLDRYNADLHADVEAKTERIVAMHDQLILGMAAMVESRDNSTGGHTRRTSEGVRILVEQIRADAARGEDMCSELRLSDEFCRNLIKAAPMHDLGKIAVDDAVLRKPGRFTPEEFDKMKAHASEGARIVHEILRDTDDEEFRRVAENMAHYHHERVDGSGYPEGLAGDAIPLEARIMAIADVYDALVSKRVYKESFSFEKADRIILEGMGTQFDARLEHVYRAARPRLEAYYTAESQEQ